MKNLIGLLAVILTFASGCNSNNQKASETVLTLINHSSIVRNEVVEINLSRIAGKAELNMIGMGQIGKVPIEAIDEDNDGTTDQLLAHVNIPANESIELNLNDWQPNPAFQKRTQAEISTAVGGAWKERKYLDGTGFKNVDFLSVPKAHTDHSWYIRYEGPGWENELVGYRFYLDWRNATDIFGKKVDTLVLQQVGQDGFDSYHEEEDWGMDILKAGKSLGIGSIGRINDEGVVEHFKKTDSVTCEITRNGYLSSSIETNYYGWDTSAGKCDLKSTLKINSGDRATIHKVSFGNEADNFCTGVVKHPAGEFFQASADEWGYIATFGAQTLFNDNLGMAIFYKTDQLLKVDTADAYNQLLVFKPTESLEYQFLGAWEKEPNGIQTKEAFETYLNKKLTALHSPIEVK
ncbi:MAG: DUF4861 family protein [Cyclobacteriaceae bacterium]